MADNTAQDTAGSKMVGEGIHFDRIRRITGFLVGSIDRFNNSKRAEVHDRIKHFNNKPNFSSH